MKKKLIWVAEDGREFKDITKCEEYEHQLISINGIMNRLPTRDNDTFDKGGYIQHDRLIFLSVRSNLLIFARKIIADNFHWAIRDALEEPKNNQCYIGQLIEDSGHDSLNQAWKRFECTDSEYREWQQPVFRHQS